MHADCVLSNCECLECGASRPGRVLRALGSPTRVKCVGQLLDSKDPLTAVSATLVLADASQVAKIVFVDCLLRAALLEFTRGTMAI